MGQRGKDVREGRVGSDIDRATVGVQELEKGEGLVSIP